METNLVFPLENDDKKSQVTRALGSPEKDTLLAAPKKHSLGNVPLINCIWENYNSWPNCCPHHRALHTALRVAGPQMDAAE